jgi:hypothetical protein
MAAVGAAARLSWSSRAFAQTALRTARSRLASCPQPCLVVPIAPTPGCCCCSRRRRSLHATPQGRQLVPVPADKYLNIVLPEQVQRAAAQAMWDDPRNVNTDQPSEESLGDPTIRHFTVNFVSASASISLLDN